MRSRFVIVTKVGAKSAFQVQLIEDDDMVEALATEEVVLGGSGGVTP